MAGGLLHARICGGVFPLANSSLQGPRSGNISKHISFWKGNVLAGVTQKDPSIGVLGPDELANKSLRPMLARYLMQLPADHPGRFPGAAHIDFLRLPPATANLIIKIVTLGSFLIIVWLFVRSPADLRSPAILWECAVMSILMLLYSPITWGEHCVALIPAVYLVCLRFSTGKPVPRWIKRTMAAVVFLLILVNRSLLGTWFSELAESYHFITFCMIALAAVSLAFWGKRGKSPTRTGQIMSAPKVSVCIDVYNYEAFLPEAIESVLRQKFTDFEVIVVDDCSKDRSFEIAQSYAAKDSRVIALRNPANLGMVQKSAIP